FVSIMPAGWFSDSVEQFSSHAVGYHKSTFPDMVLVEARTPAHPTGSSIVAHELGHSYGLHVTCEDYYDGDDCVGEPDRVGSPAAPGLWVERRIPMVDREIFAFMGAHTTAMTEEYWA